MNEKPTPKAQPVESKNPSTSATAEANPGSTPQPVNPPVTKAPADLGA
jgi:hypothetical protein